MRTPVEILVPTAAELEALENLYRTTKEVRLRTRVQMISAFWGAADDRASHCQMVRENDQTVRNWRVSLDG